MHSSKFYFEGHLFDQNEPIAPKKNSQLCYVHGVMIWGVGVVTCKGCFDACCVSSASGFYM